MSQHPSLRSSGKLTQQRNVLKRYERVLRILKEKGEEGLSVFALPKYKRPRLKAGRREVVTEEGKAEEKKEIDEEAKG